LADLPAGEYTITELIAPEGYKKLTDPIKVTVKEQATVDLEIENNPLDLPAKLGKLKVIKKDADDESKRLSEAIFEIESKDGVYKNLFMTDENGEALLENIPFGDYVITEMKEPS